MTSLDESVGRLRSAASVLLSAAIPRPLPPAPSPRPLPGRGERSRCGSRLSAEGPLRAGAADHHRADGDAAVGCRLHVRRAAMEHGQATPVLGGDARNRDADRRLSRLIRKTLIALSSDASRRIGSALSSTSCPRRNCRRRARSRSSRSSIQTLSEEIRKQIGPPVLDRHGRPLVDRRNPHPARQHVMRVFARAQRTPTPRTRRSFCCGWWHVARAADHRHPVPAQSDQADRAACRRRRELSARAGRCRTSVRAARARCGAPRRLSSK